jgi:hypothetical protein
MYSRIIFIDERMSFLYGFRAEQITRDKYLSVCCPRTLACTGWTQLRQNRLSVAMWLVENTTCCSTVAGLSFLFSSRYRISILEGGRMLNDSSQPTAIGPYICIAVFRNSCLDL